MISNCFISLTACNMSNQHISTYNGSNNNDYPQQIARTAPQFQMYHDPLSSVVAQTLSANQQLAQGANDLVKYQTQKLNEVNEKNNDYLQKVIREKEQKLLEQEQMIRTLMEGIAFLKAEKDHNASQTMSLYKLVESRLPDLAAKVNQKVSNGYKGKNFNPKAAVFVPKTSYEPTQAAFTSPATETYYHPQQQQQQPQAFNMFQAPSTNDAIEDAANLMATIFSDKS